MFIEIVHNKKLIVINSNNIYSFKEVGNFLIITMNDKKIYNAEFGGPGMAHGFYNELKDVLNVFSLNWENYPIKNIDSKD